MSESADPPPEVATGETQNRRTLIKTPSRCGHCLRVVTLAQGLGYDALIDQDQQGFLLPHVCAGADLAAWYRHRPRRKFETFAETRCGVCTRSVWLGTAIGHHSLYDREFPSGELVPHVCPEADIERWDRNVNRILRSLGLTNRPEIVP